MELSIIIPVYKVEEYLRDCLDSCLHQGTSPNDYELICVNDGSPDNCGLILEEYSAKYSNIRVITQQNQGLSMARNNGLKVAMGEYIWFIDSDDWVEPNALNLISKALQNKPEILEIGFNYAWTDRVIRNQSFRWDNAISGREAYLKNGIATPAQFTIVKRSLLNDNDLKFYPDILHEDTEYKPKLAILANTAACIDIPIYNYRQRESGSIMSTYSIRNARDLITSCRSLIEFISNRKYNKQEHEVIGDAIGANVNHLLNRLAHYKGEKRNIINIMKENRDLINWLNRSRKLKYRFEAYIFCFNFKFALNLLQFLQIHR